MKKLVASTLFITLFCLTVNAQKGSSFGLKAGLNYNANGDYIDSFNSNIENPDRNIGYHFGIFGKLGNKVCIVYMRSILRENK